VVGVGPRHGWLRLLRASERDQGRDVQGDHQWHVGGNDQREREFTDRGS
jgi:hypothetical protein